MTVAYGLERAGAFGPPFGDTSISGEAAAPQRTPYLAFFVRSDATPSSHYYISRKVKKVTYIQYEICEDASL